MRLEIQTSSKLGPEVISMPEFKLVYTNCKRCGKRMIAIEGREYGPVCARKLAGQVHLDSQALVSGIALRK